MLPDASTRWIASLLGNDPEAVERLSSATAASFMAAAGANGVLCLAARTLRLSGRFDDLPHDLREQLLRIVRREQGLELARRAELTRTSEGFAAAGVPALMFKGAALAYTHYPFPHLRPRVDTDLLVPADDRARAVHVLQCLGYEQEMAVERGALFTQATFYRCSASGVGHQVDLHWRIANRPLFRDLLSYEELAREAVPVRVFGASARSPGALHSLLLACIHPVAHHHCEWPLIWLYDVSLLAECLSASDWRRFRSLAIEKKVSLICKRTFQLTEECFGPAAWLAESSILDISEESARDEPSSQYLTQEVSIRKDLLLDLSALHGLTAKCRLLLSHAFPDVHYIRGTYGASGWVNIASAYGRRLTNAGAQLLWRDRGGPSSAH
jgi:hypothetical protein